MKDEIAEHHILSVFQELLVASPSGQEQRVAAVVSRFLEETGYEFSMDGVGNLTVTLPGREPAAPLCMFAAHMDEIAIVVTAIDPDGSLRVDRLGGLMPWKIGEGPVEILGQDSDSIVGILSMGSTHTPDAATKSITWHDCRITTGLSPQQLEDAGVRPGVMAVPTANRRDQVLFGDADNPMVAAWTFDDRMGVVMLLKLLEALEQRDIKPWHPTVVAFTVQEEIGCHGAKILTQMLRPHTFIAIDGCPVTPGSPLELDGRPGIWSKDRVTVYDQQLLRDLCAAADVAGTELQPVVLAAAASDASMVHSAGAVQRIACMGHVRENSHGFEVARLAVFDNVLNTLVTFVSEWEG